MKFCAKCGRKGETREGLCDRCYSEALPQIKLPKEIKIKMCEGCNKVLHRNLWSRYHSINDAVERIVMESLKLKKDANVKAAVDDKGIEAEIDPGDGRIQKLPVKIEDMICHKCRKFIGKYFEGTLQLRNVSDDLIKYVLKDIEEKNTEGVFVKEIDEFKNGIDIKVTSQKYILALGARLRRKFGGSVKVTRNLFTRNRQTSKEVFRVTLLYNQKAKA
jgi:NMD protein affecting ribosome stability and mRNA decay